MGQPPADQETTATLFKAPPYTREGLPRVGNYPSPSCSEFEGPNWRKWSTFLCERAGRRAGLTRHSVGSPSTLAAGLLGETVQLGEIQQSLGGSGVRIEHGAATLHPGSSCGVGESEDCAQAR
jgi:hypothetical protein